MTALERVLALAHDLGLTTVKEYARLERGKLEHVGQYERGGAHPDDAMALREHLELATLAYQRGDARAALEHLENAKHHMAAPPGHGNSTVHGVKHTGGKHAAESKGIVDAMGKALHDKPKKFGTPKYNKTRTPDRDND